MSQVLQLLEDIESPCPARVLKVRAVPLSLLRPQGQAEGPPHQPSGLQTQGEDDAVSENFQKGTPNYHYFETYVTESYLCAQNDELQEGHTCINCGRSYRFKANLTRHLRQECGKEPQFQCPHCPYKAKQKSSLKMHMRNKHSGKK